MKTSLRVGRPAGIELRIHATFPLLLLWEFWRGWQEGGRSYATAQVLLTLALFVCVILHELGHGLVARLFGIGTLSIVLYPIGGVATLDRMPSRPHQEFLMTAGGPLVNVLIAAGLAFWLGGLPAMTGWTTVSASLRPGLAQLLFYNVVLAVFNLIPVFPMDGGRMLRSLLAFLMPYAKATRVATMIGMTGALGLSVLGLRYGQPFLAAIGIFIFLLARREYRAARLLIRLDSITARDLMKPAPSLSPHDPVSRCRDACPTNDPAHFGVLEGEQPIGILPDAVWRRALREDSPDRPVHSLMEPRLIALAPDLPFSRLVGLARESPQPMFPVVIAGRLQGWVMYEDIARRFHALAATPARSPRWKVDLG